MRISQKLLLLVAAPTLMLCGVAFFAAQTTETALRASIEQKSRVEARAVMDEIDRDIHMFIAEWQAYCQSHLVQETLHESNQKFAAMPQVQAYIDEEDRRWIAQSHKQPTALAQELLDHRLSRDLRSRLATLGEGFAYVVYGEVFVTNRYGANAAMSRTTSDFRQDDEGWWQAAWRDGVHVGDVGFDESAGVYSVDLCLRVEDESHKPVGVMKVVLNIEEEMAVLDARGKAATTEGVRRVSLVTRDGRLIRQANAENAPLRDAGPILSGISLDGAAPTFSRERFDEDTQDYLMSSVAVSQGSGRNPGLGWAVIVDHSSRLAFAPISRTRNACLLFAVTGGGLTLLLCGGIAHFLVKRVRRLVKAVGRIHAGDLGFQVPSEGGDELAELARDFNSMSRVLAEKSQLLADQAEELRATQATLEEQNAALGCKNTELEWQRNQLADAQQTAEAASRAKSAFLANMSHEIRTPMTAILGFAEMLVSPELGQDETRQAVETIQRNGQHLLSLINDILDLSKVEAGKLEIEWTACRPGDVLRDVVQLLDGRAQARGIAPTVECSGPIPEAICSDPTRLKQALVNLVGNAIKFTDAGGVRVVAKCDRATERLTFHVIDSGIGMSPEQLRRIFRPFSQADASTTRKHGGTGLGLTITKHIAELLGGSIAVQSESGVGSTFSLSVSTGSLSGVQMISSWRKVRDLPGTSPQDASPLPQTGGVLLVEDGPDNQRLISSLLKKAGTAVTVAQNGSLGVEAALAAWRAGHPFALILMDMQMPVMDGYDATRTLRDAGYRGQIVALTAHALKGEIDRCLAAGCDAYLSKPIDRQMFLAEVAHRMSLPTARAEKNDPLRAERMESPRM